MDALPGPEFEALIRPHVGELLTAERTAHGHGSDVTALVEGTSGRFFVKGMKKRPGGRLDSLVREGAINPYITPISPKLLWTAEGPSWVVLGFEQVTGHTADFTPNSNDLRAVTETLNRIAALALPGVAQGWWETRWDRYLSEEDAALLRGNALLYTDIQPDNFLIGPDTTWAVDWAWPTRGAGFIDPACLVHQLIAAGHTPEAAEAWASRCTAWQSADPRVVDVFVIATLRLYAAAVSRRPNETWLGAMTDAARTWAHHRGGGIDVL
ncbi:hypothetical protein [Actinomadura macrotermitis]|uniref:Protein kinase n=1 Tax=Actinomadura macrotermitis TaxID=2585200 RepID=A0A7K0BY67_9ACTN|nr:hypothetical protein [Actinomadura macrotermitis]MQY06128.1 hypothetical protein [Actinomadura macrotermitis]